MTHPQPTTNRKNYDQLAIAEAWFDPVWIINVQKRCRCAVDPTCTVDFVPVATVGITWRGLKWRHNNLPIIHSLIFYLVT